MVPVAYAPPAATLDLSALPGTRWVLDALRTRATCSDFLAPPPPRRGSPREVYSGAIEALETFERAAAAEEAARLAEQEQGALDAGSAAANLAEQTEVDACYDARSNQAGHVRMRAPHETTPRANNLDAQAPATNGLGPHVRTTGHATLASEGALARRQEHTRVAGSDATDAQRGPLNMRPQRRKSIGRTAVQGLHLVLDAGDAASESPARDLGPLRVAGGGVRGSAPPPGRPQRERRE